MKPSPDEKLAKQLLPVIRDWLSRMGPEAVALLSMGCVHHPAVGVGGTTSAAPLTEEESHDKAIMDQVVAESDRDGWEDWDQVKRELAATPTASPDAARTLLEEAEIAEIRKREEER